MPKRIFACCLLICALSGLGFGYAAVGADTAEPVIEHSDIGIFLNGTYQTDSAARGVLVDARTLVPLRFISESLGADVAWEEATQTVTVTSGAVTNVVRIGEYSAQKTADGSTQTIQLDVCPMLIDERTYVPVRYIAESMDRLVDWSSAQNAVLICDAPTVAWDGAAVSFSDGMDGVREVYGEPEEAFDSGKGFMWYVYHANTPDLMLFGEKDGAVTEFFSLSDGVRLDGALLSSLTKEELAQRSTPLVEFFYDDIGARYGGIYFSTQGSANKTYDPTKTEEEIAAAESRVIELVTNALRAKYAGLAPLVRDEAAASAARRHCTDMQVNGYFGHTGLDGSKPSERYERESGAQRWSKLGENLALNKNAFSACFAWLNSAPHRECMLDGEYGYLGVGADYTNRDKRENYYGQIYVKN